MVSHFSLLRAHPPKKNPHTKKRRKKKMSSNICFLQGDPDWNEMLRPLLFNLNSFREGTKTVLAFSDQVTLKFFPLTDMNMLSCFANDMETSKDIMTDNLDPNSLYDMPCFLPCHAFFMVKKGLTSLFNQQINFQQYFKWDDIPYGIKIMHRHERAMPLTKYIERCRINRITEHLDEEVRTIIILVLVTLHNFTIRFPNKRLNDVHHDQILVSSCIMDDTGNRLPHATVNVEWSKYPTHVRLLSTSDTSVFFPKNGFFFCHHQT